ncbi:hypothetical protein IVB34_40210 [Bradyrhizobium sp. 2]|uniref:hypothetical protein n=1 Tax=unclassified Bradyrhizobium TaxID=2631580 RepID=UPI001FF81278|nr:MULTISPECIES: hypothetical protein [unclassified Bradyrhizobium]MCK1447251.1 hypothetical protein [Bradyrhizobium sp. 48]MCK1464415.1 hypothetical protein [Bradyrhizobium sp. 2]
MTVFVYVNTRKQVGDVDHIKVFATVDAAETWFEENDPEGVAFECDVMGPASLIDAAPRCHPSGGSGDHDGRSLIGTARQSNG